MAKKYRRGKAKAGVASGNGAAGGIKQDSADQVSGARSQLRDIPQSTGEQPRSNGDLLALLTDREREVMRLYVQLLCAKEVARRLGSKVQTVSNQLASIEHKLGQADLRPRWDKEARKLSFGGLVVHRFRRPAPIVETILDAFAEEGWIDRIDDPLTPLIGRKQADRLRKEIYALNQRLNLPLIHFFMDGTGQGICWKPVTPWPEPAQYIVGASSALKRLLSHLPLF